MLQVVAVDLGGTNIRAALFPTDDPHPQAQTRTETRAHDGPEAVLGRIVESIERVAPRERREWRIGVAAPGPLDPFRGIIMEAPNLPGWDNFPLAGRLGAHFGCPVMVGNDANLAALGEWRHGAGRGRSHVVYLTISTGIGGGVIIDGRLLLGAKGLAAELGHLVVDRAGPRCSCGQIGHLEAIASGPAIAKEASRRIQSGEHSVLEGNLERDESISAVDVGRAALEGDEVALSVMTAAGYAVGQHLASLAHAFNPEVFILGGGVTNLGELYFSAVQKGLIENIMHRSYLDGLTIAPSALGDDAGLVGAMVLARGA
jgi:glucokinase